MTVKKHLEHVVAKLGVETRTADAGMAMSRIRQLHPQFEAGFKGFELLAGVFQWVQFLN